MAVEDVRVAGTRGLEWLARLQPLPPNIAVAWHDRFTDEAARYYAACRGEEWLPLDLVRIVFENGSGHRKRVAVVFRDGHPDAFVPLRLAGRYWEPLFVGVIPEIAPFPCVGDARYVLASLGLNVGVWSCLESPSGFENLRWSGREDSYDLDLRSDPEPYWRATGLWRNIRQSLQRCERFDLVRDDLDGCDWMMRRWRDQFYTGSSGDTASKWSDRIAVARWSFEHNWRMHSWHLRDGQRWISGFTSFVLGDRVSMGTTYRDPGSNWFGVGNRVFYEAVRWAQHQGFATASLGVGWEYKRRWAPPAGTQWSYVVAPLPVRLWNGGFEAGGKLVERVRALR